MASPFIAASVKSTTPTSTGTADYTSSGFGTAKAALIYVTPATADDTDTAGLSFSWGVCDGDTNRGVCGYSEDSVSTSNTGGRGSRDHCVFLCDDAALIIVEASFDSFITDGVRLNFTVVDSTAYKITVLLFGGDELLVDTGDAQKDAGSSTGSVITEVGTEEDATFEPDVVFSSFMPSITEANNPDLNAFFGISANASSIRNTCAGILSEDSAATTDTRRRIESGVCCELYNWSGGVPSILNDAIISSYSSTGFVITSSVSPTTNASPRIAYLAMKLSSSGSVPFDIDQEDPTPTVTGTVSKTWPDHLSGFLYQISSANTTGNLQIAGACGMGSAVRTTESSFALRDTRNVGTSENANYQSSTFIDSYTHNGTHLYQANVDSFDTTGFTLDFTIVDGSARGFGVLSIGLDTVQASSASSLPSLTGAGVAAHPIVGSDGGGSLPSLTGASVAVLKFSGADGAGNLPTLTGVGAATFKAVSGAGAGNLPALAGAGVALLRFSATGAGSLPALTGAGVATFKSVSGTGAGSLPALTGSGVATSKSVSGAGAGTLPVLAGSGIASLKVTSTGAGIIPALTGSGTANAREILGSGAGDLPTLTGVGVASLSIPATGAGNLPGLAGVGVASLKLQATGAGILPALTGAGVAALGINVTATGAGSLPALTGSGVVSTFFTGAGAGDLPSLLGVAAANHDASGLALESCTPLAGSYLLSTDIAGDYDTETVLTGSYNPSTALTGNIETC